MNLNKPILEYLPPKKEESFFIKSFELPYFDTPWHYHAEYELVWIIKGQGKRFIGNSISNFEDGDLSFLGANLPHLYQNPPEYYSKKPIINVKSMVLHFLPKVFGNDFFQLPELKKANHFFDKARFGLDIKGKAKTQIIDKLKILVNAKGVKRLSVFLEILDLLIENTNYNLISTETIISDNFNDSKRLNKALQYILNNFHNDICLEQVAATVHMTRTSFCRFFKIRTKRTFSDLIKDLRLTHAAKVLREGNSTISATAFSSGYSNLANFNRQFKEKFNCTPKMYQKML